MGLGQFPALAAGEMPAFPGAQGWGTHTPGGRAGKVLFVTSLADSGPGTLREALLTKGPRTILFRTSGIIRLNKQLWMCGPEFSYVTVAGQSAPGGGIALTGSDVILNNGLHDAVFRHVRFRACNEGPTVHNQCKNIVFDHCSFRHHLNPADAADRWADPDNDGYGNLEEFLNSTDPRKAERLSGDRGRNGKGIPAEVRHKPGSGGQLIAFVPSLDLIITRQTGSSGEWQFEEYLRRACQAVREHE
jgi:hypothetical protein